MRSAYTLTVVALLLSGATGVAPVQAQHSGAYGSVGPYHFRQAEIGVRSYHFTLKDTLRKGPNGPDNANWEGRINFIGSVWGLEEIQNYLPRLYAQFNINPYFGVGVSYDYIGAKTVDWGNEEKTRTTTDGNLHLQGLLAYTLLRYPLRFGITPFLEFGGAWYRANFTESAAWTMNGDGYRFQVDNTRGYFLGAGVNVELPGNWSASLYWRQMRDVEVTARAYLAPGPQVGRAGSFPMEYKMIGIGAAYQF